ncbi:MAG TPA: hypothetical protein VGG16_29960 [Streptosporangiaceae bacterium]
MSSWFQHVIVDAGKLRLFCFFAFFILAFLFIRFSVRMIRAQVKWWPGNVAPGGTHIHHIVFGLVFMCLGGIGGLAVQDPRSAWAALTASLLGIGAALVLDEFALVLHLEDVYWSKEGRLSVQVVFIAIAVCGLALLGLTPYSVSSDDETPLGIALVLLFNLPFTVVCLLKGKIWSGLLGIYITVSPWSAPSGWPVPVRRGPGPGTSRAARSWPGRPRGRLATAAPSPPQRPGSPT